MGLGYVCPAMGLVGWNALLLLHTAEKHDYPGLSIGSEFKSFELGVIPDRHAWPNAGRGLGSALCTLGSEHTISLLQVKVVDLWIN